MEYLGLIIAMGACMIALIGVVIALFIWNRSEARTDNRRVLDLITGINAEMKDFHGKLLVIEERYLKNREK